MSRDQGSCGNGPEFAKPEFEGLETRLLLTTMVVGDSFIYRGSNDDLIVVNLNSHDVTGQVGESFFGGGGADFPGSVATGVGEIELMQLVPVDEFTNELADVPGLLRHGLFGLPTEIAGGIAGGNLDTLIGGDPWTNGRVQVDTLAVSAGGTIYVYDNDDWHLYTLSPVTNATLGDFGEIVDPNPRQYPAGHPNAPGPFEDIRYNPTAMEFNDATGQVVMIATLNNIAPAPDPPIDPTPDPLPAGPHVIFITPGGAVVRGPALTQNGQPYGGTVEDITYHNGQLWGTNGTILIRINTTTGVVTDGPDVANVGNLTGLQDVGGQLYGVGGSTVYVINDNGSNSQLYGGLSRGDLTDLGSNGTTLWGVYSSNGETRLCRIELDPPVPTDIFSLYIKSADQYTILSVSAINGTAADPNWTGYLWGDTGNTAALAVNNAGVTLAAPAGSGPPLIGGERIPTNSNAFQNVAITEPGVWSSFFTEEPILMSPLGVYPGGEIYPGIWTAGPMGEVIEDDAFAGLGLSVDSLASDSAGNLFAVDNQTHQLKAANYSAFANETTATAVGTLVDSADATWRHDKITALDFDSGDVLYGISSLITDTAPGAPLPPAGTWLVTINTATGVVTRVGAALSIRGATENIRISAIAFGPADTLYAVEANGNILATIDPATGVIILIDEIFDIDTAGPVPPIVGLDFMNGYLYGLTATGMYSIDTAEATASTWTIDPALEDPITGLQSRLGPTGLTDHTGLDYDDARGRFWSVTFDGGFKLVWLDETTPVLDMGRILVYGTVTQTVISGNLDVLDVGYMYGNVDVAYDLNNIIVHTDYARASSPIWPDNALVSVGGTLRELDIYGTGYNSINVEGGLSIPVRDPGLADYNNYPIWEMEYKAFDNPNDWYYEGNNPNAIRGNWAIDGNLMTVNDDSTEDAQFLFNASGNTILWGEVGGNPVQPNDEYDYYAISLMAGQTIVLDGYAGYVDDPRAAMFTLMDVGLAAGVFDANMNYLASVGFETYEDWGIGSRGVNQEPLTFTAPQAGVYYIVVAGAATELLSPPGHLVSLGTYTLFVNGGPQVGFGALDVKGDYNPGFFGEGVKYEYDVAVQNGDFGAYDVSGVSRVVDTFVIGGGNLVSYRAGQIGVNTPAWAGDTIVSDSNIGLVQSTTSFLDATIIAGATDAAVNNNAVIQNVISAGVLRSDSLYTSPTTLLWGLESTGGIGTVEVAGDVHWSTQFVIDSDSAGPGARLDYLHAGGDWGSLAGFPEFFHGSGSDVGFVIIEGTIYGEYGGWIGPIEPVVITKGTVSRVEDDGGGQLQIAPVGAQLDEDRAVVTVDDGTGVMVAVLSAYEYTVIPVRSHDGGPKIGGVLAHLAVTGSAVLTNFGVGRVVDIGELEMNGWFGECRIGGAGPVSVYYLDGTNVATFTNNTTGSLVSGQFLGVNTAGQRVPDDYHLERMTLAGDLGRVVGQAGQWLQGIPDLPLFLVDLPPGQPKATQMGWFGRRIHGLMIEGFLDYLSVNGHLGDLYVHREAAEIIVNRDRLTAAGRFDGVVGVVHVMDLGSIDVGDGLADDGSGDRAIAAIISEDSIDTVTIRGAGKILNGAVIAVNQIDNILGYDGAINTALILATNELNGWQAWNGGVPDTGWINTVRFRGAGGAIDGSEMYAQWIDTVEATFESDGIDHSFITGANAPDDGMGVRQILAGGPGLSNTEIASNGGPIGYIKGTAPQSDIRNNVIDTTDNLLEVSGRTISGNLISVPGRFERMRATLDISANEVTAGAILDLRSGTNFAGNVFEVATEVQRAFIGGHFRHSWLILQGPEGTYLGQLDVVGNISGRIEVAGTVDTITSRLGLISADIITIENPVGADVHMISARRGYTGSLTVAGDLDFFYCYGTLGPNPEDVANYLPERIDVMGNVTFLGVFSLTGAPSHCYTAITIGGNATRLFFQGSLLADVTVNGDALSIIVNGSLGGLLNLPVPTVVGNLTVHGALFAIQLGAGANIIGNLTTGGTLNSLVLVDNTGLITNGNVIGNVTSLHGEILSISISNGQVLGNISGARGLGPVIVTGTGADPAHVTGDITSELGRVQMVRIVNGFLDGNVRAMGGDLGGLFVINGNVLAGNVIESSAFVKVIQVTNGSFAANVVAAVGMTTCSIVNGNLTGNFLIHGSANAFVVSGGNVVGSDIWIHGKLTSFVVIGDMVNAVLRTLSDMTAVTMIGNVTNTQIIGGYRPAIGADPERTHSANLATLHIGGNFDVTSVVALGVHPGDGNYFTLGDNTPAPGVSRMGTMRVLGAANGLLTTDSGWRTIPAGLATQQVEAAPPAMPGVPLATGWNAAGADGVRILYLPGSGTAAANYDLATGQITLHDPSPNPGNSRFIVDGTGPAKAVHVVGGDDDGVSALLYQGTAQAGNVGIDGPVGTFTAPAAAAAPVWDLPGGVTSLFINGPVNNAAVTAGTIGSARFNGAYTGGAGGFFTADQITASLYVFGELSAPVMTTLGTFGGLHTVGLLAADVTAQYGLGWVTAMAGIGRGNGLGAPDPYDGDILVRTGSLGSLKSFGDVLSSVEVPAGAITSVAIYNGVFGTVLGDNALRSLTGITSFTIVGGDANGLISTDGPLVSLVITLGELHSRVRAGTVRVVSVGAMRGALVTATGHVYTVVIRGDMFLSDVVSGFDPADAGYDAAHGGNAANVRFDGRTFPAAWNTVANADFVGGGDVWTFICMGDMSESSVAAAISPGPDGWFGTDDDLARGTGYVRSARIFGTVTGSGNSDEHYGIYAASGPPVATASDFTPFVPFGNFGLGDLGGISGAPRVTNVRMFSNRVVISFSGEMDFSSFNDAWHDPTKPTTMNLTVSQDSEFGPNEADDVSISDTVPHTLAYDEGTRSLTLRLDTGTWETLNRGTNFLLELDGDLVLSLAYRVADDGDPLSYVEAGGAWADEISPLAYQGNARTVAVPTGANTAEWDFAVTGPGTYDVYVTWVPNVGGATNAAYSVYDGAVLEETVNVNQQLPPDGIIKEAQLWQHLGQYEITNAQLRVELTDAGANGSISADAVLIDRMPAFPGEYAVTNQRGVTLDGEFSEFTHRFPSGNGVVGGDFRYRLAYGDPGDTIDSATHLTTGVPILQYNDVLTIEQEIGDSDNPVAEEDVDWFAIDVKAGDILYAWSPTNIFVYPDPELVEQVNGPPDIFWGALPPLPHDPDQILEPSLSGSGMRAIQDGTVYVTVSGQDLVEDFGWWGEDSDWVFEGMPSGYVGPYALNILLFNDGNSNFTFDDATQAPTPVAWVANEARPDEQDQEIIAPDDVDVYDLGVLPAFTRLDLALDTTLIGSDLEAKAAVFNSAGDLVGTIMFGGEVEGITDIGVLDLGVTLEGSVLTPAADNYYLAVSGLANLPMFGWTMDDFLGTYAGLYDLVVTQTAEPPPVFGTQWVYVNFNGGVADYLPEALDDPRVDPQQEALRAQTFGFRSIELNEIIDAAMARIQEIYANFNNIRFTTVRPVGVEYSTLFISNNIGPEIGLLGLAEAIDTDNSNHSDDAVVFGGEYAYYFHANLGNTPTEVGIALGNTGAHELGHILGLNHVQNNFSVGGGTWILDNDDPASYSEIGTDWVDDPWNWDAWDWDGRMVVVPTGGTNEAWWELRALEHGVYQVYVTWAEDPTYATDAPFTVYDGAVAEATIDLDQTAPPDDITYRGQQWESLGAFDISSRQIRVQLTDDTVTGSVYADAVMIVYHDLLVDDMNLDYTETGLNWVDEIDDDAYQFGARAVPVPPGGGINNTATWTIPVPAEGYYQVYVTWPADLGLGATDAPFSVYDGTVAGGVLEETVDVDQRFEPDDLIYNDQGWQRLGSYEITNGQITVQLTDDADGKVIADAVLVVYRDWVMGYDDDGTNIAEDFDLRMQRFTTHERLMTYPSDEFLIGYQNSMGSLWTIA